MYSYACGVQVVQRSLRANISINLIEYSYVYLQTLSRIVSMDVLFECGVVYV